MTRDEAEKLLVEASTELHRSNHSYSKIRASALVDLLCLARLGLRVECPSEEDVECACVAFQGIYGMRFNWNDISDKHRAAIREAMRAALAALRGE